MSRDEALATYYHRGFSMRETAVEFSISLERVRQILRRDFPHLIRRAYDTRQNSTGLASNQRRQTETAE